MKAGETGLWDLIGMPAGPTYGGCVFGRLLESTLDCIVSDAQTAARWIGADTISLSESLFPTDHKALVAKFRMSGMGDWNIQERAHRWRPGRRLKAWAPVDPAAFATRVRGELGMATQSIARATEVFRECALECGLRAPTRNSQHASATHSFAQSFACMPQCHRARMCLRPCPGRWRLSNGVQSVSECGMEGVPLAEEVLGTTGLLEFQALHVAHGTVASVVSHPWSQL